MDLKRLISQVSYKIEPKPEGGFIARPTDPTLPAIEAASREELLQKIQQRTLDFLFAEMPGLKLPPGGKARELSFHIESKPGGGFSIHSTDPDVGVVHAGDDHELQSHALEKILDFAGKHMLPDAAKALAAQAGAASIKVVVNGKTTFRINSSPQGSMFGAAEGASFQNGSNMEPSMLTAPASTGGTIDAKPIVPEPSNAGKVFGILILMLVLGFILYFFYR